ncbi:MAG TPA: hypothetical protein VMU84_13355, partial [Thermoanaerobaculia bacterium]|nr:hypothetical protein [Thermoanaerobaculia bacterium]
LLAALLSPPNAVEVERFHLQSNPWVNLHQRLLYAANFEAPPPQRLTDEERATWLAAVETYRTYFAKRSPIFDQELVKMNAALSATFDAELPKTIPPLPADVLRKLIPVYMRVQWKDDDFTNQFWISLAKPMLASAAKELIAAHEKAYGMPFPKRVRIDVSAFAGEYGAYTVGDAESVHSTLSPNDPAYQGFAALEMLMHETSHGIVDINSGAIGADLNKAAKELHRRYPPNLWHALLFYTSGELARAALARRGIMDYQPIIYRGMFDRQFRGFQQSFETHWRAMLEGKISREEAMKQIVTELGKPEQPVH